MNAVSDDKPGDSQGSCNALTGPLGAVVFIGALILGPPHWIASGVFIRHRQSSHQGDGHCSVRCAWAPIPGVDDGPLRSAALPC